MEKWNPQVKSFLEEMIKKENSCKKKGWKIIEGYGYHYDKPKGWTESKDMKKATYFLLTSPNGKIKIRLTSRYIESIPDGVHNLHGWIKLQYALLGIPEALEETHKIKVTTGDALEAIATIYNIYTRSLYFVDIFQHPDNRRMWLLIIETQNKSQLYSADVQNFLNTFLVENFQW